jgi:AcrR family transcriptional regulator
VTLASRRQSVNTDSWQYCQYVAYPGRVDEAAQPGRRERHKVATRQALRDAARRLFAEQGFGATTVQQIADAADVSERTFFRYFETKEDLLLPDLAALFGALAEAIERRPLDEPPLTSILEATLTTLTRDGGTDLTVLAPGIDPANQAVSARVVRAFVDWEDRLTRLLLARFAATKPADADDDLTLDAAVVAHAALSATRAALRTYRARQTGDQPEPVVIDAMIRRAFAVLAAGCQVRTVT